jgi:endogenous inhibitor of DNA gyrase (YacG/DUF329 family)
MKQKKEKCKYCSADLEAKTTRREFCSNKCKVYWHRENKVELNNLNVPTNTKKIEPPKTSNVAINTKPDISDMEALFQKLKNEQK